MRPKGAQQGESCHWLVLSKLIGTCRTDNLRHIGEKAILIVDFASGGRHRSEIAGLKRDQLQLEEPICVDGVPPLLFLSIHLGRAETSGAESDEVV